MKVALFRGNYIGGRWVRPSGGAPLVSEDPGDLAHPVGAVREDPSAVDAAVAAAARAWPAWSGASFARRRRALKRFQQAVRRHRVPLATMIAREVGKPWWEAMREVDRLIARVDETVTYAWPRVRPLTVPVAARVRGICRYRPQGVLAILGPCNFPAHIPASQFLPGLLTGNTIVFKPSEFAPFVGQMLAACAQEAGLPAGVFNVVAGGGAVGARLIEQPAVRAVLFTGSVATGRRIQQALWRHANKSVALEMGGKNAALVLADADVRLAAREAAIGAYAMAGQRCNATSRIILHRRRATRFLDEFLPLVDRLTIGHPMTPGTFMGPLVSRAAVAKYRAALAVARRDGYEPLRPGGPASVAGYRGHYVRPSVHLCERPGSIRKGTAPFYRTSEIFGPDVAIYLVRSTDEAIALNNDVPYGLVTSLFTRSRRAFEAVSRRVDTGLVNWNRGTIGSSGLLPFGGTKASGNQQPAGLFAIHQCVYPVAVLEDERPLVARDIPPGFPA
ncbi:MAG: aldehyde dehydrogenase family protein [Candidatus Omnitrophica bacterium]|nr:aldehyde dehydrogenase family protein [Candidatus Omnitrophota bacterium]